MDRNIFMTFDDFVFINSLLLKNTGFILYRSESYEDPYLKTEPIDNEAWNDSGMRALSLLIGNPENEAQILGDKQMDVGRARRVGFVSVDYGGDDEYAIGATWYSSDNSDTAKLVNRELNKLLKKYAHKGMVDAAGNPMKNYYWTDGALASRKNWHLFLNRGIYKARNKNPGHRPMSE